jgi:hypothetical protein
MKLLAMITDPSSVARYLTKLGEPTDAPRRSPSRGPPYSKSRVLRLKSMHSQATLYKRTSMISAACELGVLSFACAS